MSIVAPERTKTSGKTLESAEDQAIRNTHNHSCAELARLDELLFTAPYFLIDADNHKISDMLTTRPEHTQQPIVGTLHPNVLAIDFDLDNETDTAWALHHLINWCEDHATWYAHRASGGGPGRRHFFAIPHAEHRDELASHIEKLRIELNVSKTHIDVRDKLRLLSSPHRLGGARGPLEVSSEQMPDLEATAQDDMSTKKPRIGHVPMSPPLDGQAALSPYQRSLAANLDCSKMDYYKRSGREFLISLRLKAQGATAHAVFNTLIDPTLRDDIGKAAENGFHWFYKHVWEKIEVKPADPQKKLYDWTQTALPMSQAVRAVWGNWSTRHKHTVEHVAVVAAARLTRYENNTGPLPLRDLVEDTGIDIATISNALKTLCAAGLLIRTERFKLTESSVAISSDHYALAIKLDPASLTPTTSLYSQMVTAPYSELWLGLPPAALSTTLSIMHASAPLTLPELLQASGYSFSNSPSTRQKSLGKELLATLQAQKILHTTDSGKYQLNTGQDQLNYGLAGRIRRKTLRSQHRKERHDFRTKVTAFFEKARELKEAWNKARAEAIERNKQQRRAGQRAWWAALSPERRERRREIFKEMWWNSTDEERQIRQAKIDASRPATDPAMFDLAA